MRKILAFTILLTLCGCGTFGMFSGPPPVYVVFFPDRTTTLTSDGQTIVTHAAQAAMAHGSQSVSIAGPSTKVAPGYDPALAEPRMEAVEAALIAQGVARSRLIRASETTDGVNVKSDPSGAQRVEIRLVDKPVS